MTVYSPHTVPVAFGTNAGSGEAVYQPTGTVLQPPVGTLRITDPAEAPARDAATTQVINIEVPSSRPHRP